MEHQAGQWGDGRDKKIGAALFQREVHFRRLLEKLPAGAYTCDANGLITYFNQHAVQVWGRAPKLNDPVDRFCGSFKLYSADGTPITHAQCWMALALQEGMGFNGEEIIVERPDGRRLTVLAHANPIHDDDGTLVGAVNVLVDISDRKQAEQKLAASEDNLRQLNETLERRVAERTADFEARNRDLQQFAYAASHDLQEPLRKVHTFVDLLTEEYGAVVGSEGRTYLERIRVATRRMSTLIQDLLSYSSLSIQARRYLQVDLNQIAEEVVSDLHLRIEEAGGRVTVDHLPKIDADPAQMRQLFQNLIGNAVKFRRPGVPPVVEITASVDGEACCLMVRDNGIGFDEQYAGRIFAPFQRLHTQDEYEGTGIGLALCQRIAERHNGAISARSTLGQGTSFEVHLPVQQRDTAVRKVTLVASPAPPAPAAELPLILPDIAPDGSQAAPSA